MNTASPTQNALNLIHLKDRFAGTLTGAITKKMSLTQKEGLVSTFLVANAFVWYLCGLSFLQESSVRFGNNSLLIIVTVNFASLAIAALAASTLANKAKNRLTFLKDWIIAGVLLSSVFAVINVANFGNMMVLSALIGVYFGLGMPTCMGYYARTTTPKNRAKHSGIIILLIGICLPLVSIIGSDGILFLAATLAVWRILSLAFTSTIKPTEEQIEPKEKVTYRSVVSNKTFLLYAASWLMFSLVNDLTLELNTTYFSSSIYPAVFGQTFMLVENVLAGASAIVCGILADRKGRKRIAMVGFVLLGFGYASLGLFTSNYFVAWFYVCVDGIAWGALSMLFLTTIWGDIAQEKSSEKYYILGVLPYLFSSMTRVFFGSYISGNMEQSMVFSFASFFLFVAILPLARAPETLSDKLIKNLELNDYVKKALEKAKKDTSETQSKRKTNLPQQHEKGREEPNLDEAEYEEARKLAEKYY
jgi:MFS family permease